VSDVECVGDQVAVNAALCEVDVEHQKAIGVCEGQVAVLHEVGPHVSGVPAEEIDDWAQSQLVEIIGVVSIYQGEYVT